MNINSYTPHDSSVASHLLLSVGKKLVLSKNFLYDYTYTNINGDDIPKDSEKGKKLLAVGWDIDPQSNLWRQTNSDVLYR